MYLRLSASSLDSWLGDFDAFHVDFRQQCQMLAKSVGYYFEFDQAALARAHATWKATCDHWTATLVDPNSTELSHLKIMGIFLGSFSAEPWIKSLFEFDFAASRDAQAYQFRGTASEKEETRKDINAGREAFFSFYFAMMVLNWFEANRIDRQTSFVYRMTRDLEHDLLVYLCSDNPDVRAVFLVLKALYARD